MKFTVIAVVLTFVWSTGLVSARAGQGAKEQGAKPGTSTWSGVYTDEQAKSGQTAYTKACSECHGEALEGDGFAPALKGPEFMNNWNSLSVGELFDRIRVSMPPTDPNSVSVKDKVDIVAYILKQDGFPAGKTPLPATLDAMKTIKFEATKPGR